MVKPNEATSPVALISSIMMVSTAFFGLRQQIRDDARIHGIITEGGVAPNIIPDKASARFYIRALELHYLYVLIEKVKACAQGAATATGARVKIETPGFIYKSFRPHYAFAKAAISKKGMQGVIAGAKVLALTAVDIMEETIARRELRADSPNKL